MGTTSTAQPFAIAWENEGAQDGPRPAESLLLIERDPAAARLIAGALGRSGFIVHRVATGEQGLDYLSARPAAAVVLEYRVTSPEGLRTLRRIRERHGCPIVMVASDGSTDHAVQAVKAGAFDFIAKRDDYLPSLIDKIRAATTDWRTRAIPASFVRPVFVGREGELRVFDDQLARTSVGEGRVVLVQGEEGIGKTSLALEISRRARGQACTVLWGQCHEAGAPAYWPWMQVLRSHVETADPEPLRDALGELATAVAWIVPTLRERWPDLPAADPAMLTRFQLVDAVTQFLKRVAARRPLVIVLDDLHRADGDSLHLLRFFATECTSVPLLLIGTYRDRDADRAMAQGLALVAGLPLTTVLRLGGLAVTEVRRYVAEATQVQVPETLARAIHAKTEGHPLFVAEVTRLLAADGQLSDSPGRSDYPLTIPATRRQAIADRLDRLSERCRTLLGVAAVIGTDFTTELLVLVAREKPRLVRDAVAEAIDEQILAACDKETGTHRFTHVLVRDVLYENLAADARSGLHRRVAAELESRPTAGGSAPLTAEPPLAAIAYHYLEAAVGTDDLGRALRWVVAAGDRAASLMAHEEAARHYETAQRLIESQSIATPIGMQDLPTKLAQSRWRAGDMSGAREVGRRALIRAKRAGEPAEIATAALTFAGRLPGFGAMVSDAEEVAELEQALALLPASATALRAEVMARLAEELAHSARLDEEQSLGQQAIDLARQLGDPAVLAAVLRTTQWSIWSPGAVERRRQLASEILGLADQLGDRVLGLDGELLRLWSALEHGETDAAWRQLALCTRRAAELRLPHYTWVTAAARACLHIATGRLDDGERLAEEAAEAGAHTGNPAVALIVGGQSAHVKSLRGRFGEVPAWILGALTDFPILAATMECTLITTYARAGQRDRARTGLTGFAADDFARVPRNAIWLANMAFLADATATIGDREAAQRLYPRLVPFASYNVVLPPAAVFAPVSHYLGGLAVVGGDRAAAIRHYDEALLLEERTGSPQWTACTEIAYGSLLVQSPSARDRERGAQLLASGRAIAEELGLEPAMQEADAAVGSPRPVTALRAVYRRVDSRWEIAFHGRRTTISDSRGLKYLRCLLERPGVHVSAIELASLGADASIVDRHTGPIVDRKAMMQVRHRLSEIEADIAASKRRGIVVSAELLQEQVACAGYLRQRGSELVSAAERARSSVTKAIRRALDAIAEVHVEFGSHLERHIETGRSCVYVSDAVAPVQFDF